MLKLTTIRLSNADREAIQRIADHANTRPGHHGPGWGNADVIRCAVRILDHCINGGVLPPQDMIPRNRPLPDNDQLDLFRQI